MSSLSDEYSKNFSSERKADFNKRFREDYDPAMSELSNILRILAEMRQGSAEGGIMRVAYQDGTPERKNYETPVTDVIKSVNNKTMDLASQAVDAFDRYSGIDQITSSNFPGMNDSAIGAPSDFRHQAAANALAEALGKGKVGPVGYLSGGIGSFGLGTIKEIGDLFAGLVDKNTTAKDAFSQAYEDTISNFKGAFAPTGTTSEDLYAEIMKDYVPMNRFDLMPFRSRSFLTQKQKEFINKNRKDKNIIPKKKPTNVVTGTTKPGTGRGGDGK
jgi:hypothetical protein